MLFLFCILALAAAADEGGSWWDKVKGKVDKITTGASLSCQNPYITGPFIEAILCDAIIPESFTQLLGDRLGQIFKFGPSTVWCKALACAYRGMGCATPTYRVESKIIAADPDMKSETCVAGVGLDAEHCVTMGKFIHKVTPRGPVKKRSAAEMTDDEKREAMLSAVLYHTHMNPDLETDEMFDQIGFTPYHLEKREGELEKIRDLIVDNLQVCSITIKIGVELFLKNFKGVADKFGMNASEHMGPCGTVCSWATCGFNVICGSEPQHMELIRSINEERVANGCSALKCRGFLPAPPSQCEGITCEQPEGFYTLQNCPAPKVIVIPEKRSKEDCCEKCDDRCGAAPPCPTVQCNEPEFPRCAPYKIDKFDPYDCCKQCIDPCALEKAACPAPPTSCPAGQFLGPGSPGDCCLSCRPSPCLGVRCPAGTPRTASDCTSGTFVDKGLEATRCSECCPYCEGAKTDAPMIQSSASAVSVAGAAAAAAAVAVSTDL